MVPDSEQAIRAHKAGDIFTVDVPDNNWYYGVRKTADDQVVSEKTIFFVRGITSR